MALQGTTCKSPWFTLSFAKGDATGGKGTLEVAESCRGKKSKSKQPFAWQKNADGGFDLVTKPLEVGGVKLPEKATLKLDDTYQQLKLVPGGDADAIGTFEPGVAQVDDSVWAGVSACAVTVPSRTRLGVRRRCDRQCVDAHPDEPRQQPLR